MPDQLASNHYLLPDGSRLGLDLNRLDEQQRRQRLVLTEAADAWDYAPIIDVIIRPAGSRSHHFSGLTADAWRLRLRSTDPASERQFSAWYEAIIGRRLALLAQLPRVPDNHYCAVVARPPLASSLPGLIRKQGMTRAPAAQWLSTLRAAKGVRLEELQESGLVSSLEKQPPDQPITKAQLLQMIRLSHLTPTLCCEAKHGFASAVGWREVCERVPEREYKRRLLVGKGSEAQHLVRYRHLSLGWMIVRTRFSDLITPRSLSWSVMDEKGRVVGGIDASFATPSEAMAYATQQMANYFTRWHRSLALKRWERFTLTSGEDYRELLVVVDNWTENYTPRHFRTRNVLVHIRNSIRKTSCGRRVLFLDEVQSDWHADLQVQASPNPKRTLDKPVPEAPFRKEWDLLSLKLMLWWAQRLGLDGLAWSTAELQNIAWGPYGPPTTLYDTILPKAAESIAKVLGLRIDATSIPVRSSTRKLVSKNGQWIVFGSNNHQLTKPFASLAQAEHFANLTGTFVHFTVPVMWLEGLAGVGAIPLYGVATKDFWLNSEQSHSGSVPERSGSDRLHSVGESTLSGR